MASLQQRNGPDRIVFRFGGPNYSRSQKTSNQRAVELARKSPRISQHVKMK